MKKVNNERIPDDDLIKLASLYSTHSEFIKKERSAYTILSKRKLLGIACVHMKKKDINGKNHPGFKYTDDSIAKKALKCKTKKEFRKKYSSLYILAHNRGIIDKITAHMIESNPSGDAHSNTKYSFNKIEKIAKRFSDRTKFKKEFPNEYMAAYRKNFLDKICSHMPVLIGEKHPNIIYKSSDIIKEGSKYKTKGDFMKANPNLYSRASKRKLFDKIDFSGDAYVNSSSYEKTLFDIIKLKFPKTQKFKDRKIMVKNKPHIYGFDLDIYIPELRKGIEFDGTYWHSIAGLKRGRPEWPVEDLENYHVLKDNHFKSKGIEILHIKEEDWVQDKQACIDKCLEFLEVYQEKAA